MKEISLNILDIAMNSVKAAAKEIRITVTETEAVLTVSIADNGCGMKKDFLSEVANPFTTTRTTRKVGMGIPLFKLACEQTGGNFSIASRHESEYPDAHGTEITATFNKNHLDFTPLGDIVSTLRVLIQGSPDIHWVFVHTMPDKTAQLDTAELKAVLGDVPLDNIEVLSWIGEYLSEQYMPPPAE